MSEENDFQSNCLPILTTRNVQFCRFWCLLDRDGEEAFVVEADLEWQVSQFAETIPGKEKISSWT